MFKDGERQPFAAALNFWVFCVYKDPAVIQRKTATCKHLGHHFRTITPPWMFYFFHIDQTSIIFSPRSLRKQRGTKEASTKVSTSTLSMDHHNSQKSKSIFCTLTCSLDVTAQKTISVKPWVGNILKQMPPMTRPSLIRARVLCFLWKSETSEQCAGIWWPVTCGIRTCTYGSNTSRVMYSLGMRGNWCEKTFCRPTSHIRIFLLDFWESEFPMTWNSMIPRLSSSLAVSSRAAFGVSRLVWYKHINCKNHSGHL